MFITSFNISIYEVTSKINAEGGSLHQNNLWVQEVKGAAACASEDCSQAALTSTAQNTSNSTGAAAIAVRQAASSGTALLGLFLHTVLRVLGLNFIDTRSCGCAAVRICVCASCVPENTHTHTDTHTQRRM
jgi:hypothetical protein